jgi:uncharacterized protein
MRNACAAGRLAAVIMAKEPAAGRTKTRLCPPLSTSDAAELYEALLLDTIALLSRFHGVQLAVAVTPPSAVAAFRMRVPHDAILLPVEGGDIGACLSQAAANLFAEGFSPVIAINSDGPTLPAAYIERAEELLDHHDVVVGPCEDGGYYLVGLRRHAPGLFQHVAWSTSRVTAQTVERAATLGLSVALLPPWYDIDTAADLERLRAELAVLPPGSLTCTRRFFSVKRPAAETARDSRRVASAESSSLPQEEVGQ